MKIKHKKFYFFFSILTWLMIISGINLNLTYYNIENIKSFSDLLYSVRLYIQFIIFFVLLFLNIKFVKFLEFNDVFRVFFFYSLIQILALLLDKNNNLNIIYNISTLNLLLFLNLYFNFFCDKIRVLLYVFIGLLSLVFLNSYIEYFIVFFSENRLFYEHYELKSLFFEIKNPPRSSGIARIALILFTFYLLFLGNNLKYKNLLLICFFSLAIFMFQSRTILAIYLIIIAILSLSNYLKFYNLQIYNIKKNFYLFIFLPFILFFLVSNAQPKNLQLIINKFYTNNTTKDLFYKPNRYSEYSLVRKQHKEFSSGRFEDWKQLIKLNKNYLLGYGSQADRYLIKQTASNSILYIYSSSGIFGLLIFTYLSLSFIRILLNKKISNLLYKKKYKDNLFIFSIFILIIFLLRSIFESSFAVFGIDQILFIYSTYVFFKFLKKKNNLNDFKNLDK